MKQHIGFWLFRSRVMMGSQYQKKVRPAIQIIIKKTVSPGEIRPNLISHSRSIRHIGKGAINILEQIGRSDV